MVGDWLVYPIHVGIGSSPFALWPCFYLFINLDYICDSQGLGGGMTVTVK